jgi:membrane protein
LNVEVIIKIIWMCFLFIFTFQDIKYREIDIVGIIIFYIFIIGVYLYRLYIGQDLNLLHIILGILSGILLFSLSKFNIMGEGDAFVFIGSGALLGIKNNILLLFITVFIISFYALIMGVYCLIRGRKLKNIEVAMLPFITMANCIIWLLL